MHLGWWFCFLPNFINKEEEKIRKMERRRKKVKHITGESRDWIIIMYVAKCIVFNMWCWGIRTIQQPLGFQKYGIWNVNLTP